MAGQKHSAFKKAIVEKTFPFVFLGMGGALLASCSGDQAELEVYRSEVIEYFEAHEEEFLNLARLIDQTDGVITVADCEADDPFCLLRGSASPPLDEETTEQFIKILRELDLTGGRNIAALDQNQVNGDVTLSPSAISIHIMEDVFDRDLNTYIQATFLYSADDIFTDTNCVGQLNSETPPTFCLEKLADGWGLRWSYRQLSFSDGVSTDHPKPN
mgnify:CR=1 FL=1